jgi:hypothetical protein
MGCSRESTVRWCASGAVVLAVLAASSAARADSSAEKQAAAEALFQQGKKLMAEGDFAQACPKLASSQQLDPAVGTLLNLGDCYEKNRQLASAWAIFKDAAAAAKASGQAEREQTARRRAAALEPRLPHLVIRVPESASAGVTEIKCDDIAVPRAVWGAPLPVDPGEHSIEARGPGLQPWSQYVMAIEAKTATVTIGAQPPAPAAQPPAPAAQPPAPAAQPPAPIAPPRHAAPLPSASPAPAETAGKGNGQKVAGVIVAGAGVVTLGVGGVLALIAKSKYDNADCHDGNICKQAGYDDRQSAIDSAKAANIVFGVGVAALVTGGVLWFTAPSATPTGTGLAVQPTAGLGGGGLSVRGMW